MKTAIIFLCAMLTAFVVSAQHTAPDLSVPDSTKKILIVETACGICKFDMKGKDCELAIRLNGRTYFVEGADIDGYGDAHAKDGFCNAIRKAEVQGEIVNNHFKLTYFKLLKPEEIKDLKSKTNL
jgi:hypothetical protein